MGEAGTVLAVIWNGACWYGALHCQTRKHRKHVACCRLTQITSPRHEGRPRNQIEPSLINITYQASNHVHPSLIDILDFAWPLLSQNTVPRQAPISKYYYDRTRCICVTSKMRREYFVWCTCGITIPAATLPSIPRHHRLSPLTTCPNRKAEWPTPADLLSAPSAQYCKSW